MKYDDASWHYGGTFPADLDDTAGATHIAMFVAWCVLNGLGGELHIEDFAEDLEQLRTREVTPGDWFIRNCDSKFTDEDLSEEGNAFAASHYASEDAPYLADYENILGEGRETLYHVPDTWRSFDLLAPVLRERYMEWKRLYTR